MTIKASAADVFIIVDVQNDFCKGGALPTADGHEIVPVVNKVASRFENVVLTQDWHPLGHASFASAHPGKKPHDTIEMPYGPQVLWPDHCVQGTQGAEFHPKLEASHAQLILRKGYNRSVDSYSAFCMVDGLTKTGLAGYLRERGIARIFVAGCAIDYCVGGLALDAVKAGFETFAVADASASIFPETTAVKAWDAMQAAGVKRVSSASFE